MPIQTRCPSCTAAIPSNAAWCSLCHADLRPRPSEPPIGVGVPAVADPGSPESSDEASYESVPAGRHAVGAPVARERTSSGGGRHAAGRGRSSSRPGSRASERPVREAVLDGIEIPTDAALAPDEVDALAEQMLRRLAVTEKSTTVLDPEGLPGGKWGFAAGLMAVIVVALIAVGTVVGFLISR